MNGIFLALALSFCFLFLAPLLYAFDFINGNLTYSV